MMVEVVVSYPGETVVKEFEALVERKTVPPSAPPPSIGLVEISTPEPTDTGSDILSKLLLVDGPGSGLDADLLDGQHGAYYLDRSHHVGPIDPSSFDDTTHGQRGGGNLHALVTGAANGFMSAPDKGKLDGIEPGATQDQTPAEILTAIKTVDGSGSGLDADLLDGHDTSYFATAAALGSYVPLTTYTASDVLAKLLTVDGAGSSLDADLLDGQQGSYYLALGNATGTLSDAQHGNCGGGSLHALATPSVAGFMTDAPSDGITYARLNGAWATTSTFVDAPNDGALYGRQGLAWQKGVKLSGDTLTGKLNTLASAVGGAGLNIGVGSAPGGPVNGDLFITGTNFSARVNGVSWNLAALNVAQTWTAKQAFKASATASSSINLQPGVAPTSPADGDMWVTTTGMFARVNNVTLQMAPVDSPALTGTPTAPTAPPGTSTTQLATTAFMTGAVTTAAARNRIVNGAMQVSQELGDAGVTTAGAYGADQWVLWFIGLTNVSAGRIVNSPSPTPNGSQRCFAIAYNTAKVSLAAGDYGVIMQLIEGTRVSDFQWGTAAAKQAVLTFSLFAQAAGTFAVSIRNAANNRSWLGSFTVAAGEVNTWVRRTLVIPGDTTGTWAKDSTLGISVAFSFACGSTLLAPAGWNAGNFLGITGMANGAAAVQAFYIGDVGLYLDPNNTGVAPAWQMPDEAQELAACQRYWAAGTSLFNGNVTTGIGYIAAITRPVTMRVLPNLSAGASSLATGFPNAVGTLSNFGGLGVGGVTNESRTANATTNGGQFGGSVIMNARM